MKRKHRSKGAGTTTTVAQYDAAQSATQALICRSLRAEIKRALPNATSRVWHGAPVWFVGDTPVVGYNVPAKGGVALLFWNGQAFGDPTLTPVGKFKAARAQYGNASEIKTATLRRWLKKAGTEIWDVRSIRGTSTRAAKPG